MAVGFGSVATGVGSLADAFETNRRQALEERRQQVMDAQTAAREKYQNLYQQALMERDKRTRIKVGEPIRLPNGVVKQRYWSATEGPVTETTDPSDEDVAKEFKHVTGRDMTPEEKTAYIMNRLGVKTPTQTADMRTRQDYLDYMETHPEERGKSIEQWKTEQSTKGRVAATPVKPLQRNDRYIQVMGKPLSEWTEADKQFVQGFRALYKAQAGERAGARYALEVDPNDPSRTIYKPVGEIAAEGGSAPSSIYYRMQMPTGMERGRADLAISAREQLLDIEDVVRRRSELFGPMSGRYTDFTAWIGSQDPEAQAFKAAARVAADHLAGVFGGRSQAALDNIYKIVGDTKTNPEAAIAGLEQLDKAAATIESRGIGPAAPGGVGKGGVPKTPDNPLGLKHP